MKVLIVGLALLAQVGISPQKKVAPIRSTAGLPNFEFKSFKANHEIDQSILKDCGKIDELTSCMYMNEVLAGYPVAIQVNVYNGRLSSLNAFPKQARVINIFDVIDAFKKKYGNPCRADKAVWRNAMGAVLENPTYVWCFRTGKLTVVKYGVDIASPDIFYDDLNSPPIKPKVDF
ncbi:hypothetical protein [Sphingomonas paucimobilis]|uniref:hypothetical protein n=1 Tax=Sphingomonas paucimobilis TaxID=13689 RepID=UPI00128CA269|nr:hypothetical protein [Sphingomonas paucimobilis]